MTGAPIQSLESRILFSLSVIAPDLTALGDFNGDHKADEAIIQRDATARNVTAEIGLGTGTGIFVQSASAQILNFSPVALTIADVNGDGASDLIVLGKSAAATPVTTASSATTLASNQVIVLLGNGKGGFIKSSAVGSIGEKTYALSKLLSDSSVAVGDFDGDGFADIAVLGQANAAISTNALSNPVTAIDVLWDVNKPSLSPVSTDVLIIPPANPNVNVLFAGDLDGDGRYDLVAALSSQTTLPPTPPITSPMIGVVTVPIRPDLVTVRFPVARTSVVTIGVNPLDAPLPDSSTAVPNDEHTLGLASLIKGGPLDLVGLRGDAIVYAPYNSASQNFAAAQVAQSINAPTGLSSDAVYLADIDGDGLADLLAETPNGIFLGRNIPSPTAGSVLFSWNRVILPPVIALGI